MPRVTSNPDCNCIASFPHSQHSAGPMCTPLSSGSARQSTAAFARFSFFWAALQMQQARVTPALLRMQLPPIKPPSTQSNICVTPQHQLEQVGFICVRIPLLDLYKSNVNFPIIRTQKLNSYWSILRVRLKFWFFVAFMEPIRCRGGCKKIYFSSRWMGGAADYLCLWSVVKWRIQNEN